MKNFKNEVSAVMSVMWNAMWYAEKFDQGNESAGRRARVALRRAEKLCAATRKDMMAESKKRRED